MTVAEQLEARDREQGLKQGLQQGREEGRQEGEEHGWQEAQLSIAKKMLSAGIDIALVAQTTELTEDEIAKLIN